MPAVVIVASIYSDSWLDKGRVVQPGWLRINGWGVTMRNPGSVMLKNICIIVLLLVPATAPANWTVYPATAGNQGCVLETANITVHDGYQDTWVRLSINDERLLVKTDSNIDASFDDTGLQVDGKAVITGAVVVDEKNLRYGADMATIIEQFRKGSRVRIYLRFWPSYPATQRYEARFSLTGFTRAWSDYTECKD